MDRDQATPAPLPRRADPHADRAMLAQLLEQPPADEHVLLDLLLREAGPGRPSAYPAPVLRPVVAPRCAPAPRAWPAARVVGRPLQIAGVALLAGAVAFGGAAPSARAIQAHDHGAATVGRAPAAGAQAVSAVASHAPAPAAGAQAVSAVGRLASARALAPARRAAAPGLSGLASARALAPAPVAASGALAAAEPAAAPVAGPAAAPPEAPAFGAPASRSTGIPAYAVQRLPALDLQAQTVPPPPYPQVAPPPPGPPAGGVEIYNPGGVEVYNPQPAPRPAAPVAAPRPAPRPQPARPQPARPATGRPVQGANYTVQRGDYLRLISTWSYGIERLWPVIYDSNLRVIGANPDLIYPGQVLRIPTVAGRPQPPAAARHYTVRAGDTLAAIALRVYGNANRWPELYRANARAIGPSPNVIKPGTVLTLP